MQNQQFNTVTLAGLLGHPAVRLSALLRLAHGTHSQGLSLLVGPGERDGTEE